MFWNFSITHSLKFHACISVHTYTLITILLELRKLWFSKDFTMDLKGKNPAGHWWKWERLKLGTLEKELSDLNISNRIYNQTFICSIFCKKRKIIIATENERELTVSKWKTVCFSWLYKSQVFQIEHLEKSSTISPKSSQVQSGQSQEIAHGRSFVWNWTIRQDSGR